MKSTLVFPAFVVQAICSIDLPNEQVVDSRFWGFDEKGRYLVKSGYLCATDFYEPNPSSTTSLSCSWWKRFWSLNLPLKVKHFAWRAFHNFLAADANLVRHHVPVVGICFWCRSAWGSTTHCLIWCKKVRRYWKDSRFWVFIQPFQQLDLEDLCHLVLDNFEADGLEEFLFKLWLVWKHLCDFKHGNISDLDSLDWYSADLMLRNYHKAREKICIDQKFLPAEGLSKWYPPPKDVIRLDVDAAVRDDGGRAGAGFIARDTEGKIVLAGCQRIGSTATVLMGELHAILIAVGFFLTHDVGPVVVFTDSLLAVHVLHDRQQSSDSLCEELVEAFDHAREHVVLDFFHALREANRAANELASFAFDCHDVMNDLEVGFSTLLLDIALSDTS